MTTQVPSSMINQDGGLTASALAANAVTTVKIADANVTTTKIADANVTPAKLSQPLTLGTSQASTSGTSIDFTSIPSWAKRITVMLNAVSTSGSAYLRIQVGSGSVSTTGYGGAFVTPTSGQGTGGIQSTNNAGVDLYVFSPGATAIYYGTITLTLIASNTWIVTGIVGRNDAATVGLVAASTPALGGALDRVRITTTNGTDTFDAGAINILYE